MILLGKRLRTRCNQDPLCSESDPELRFGQMRGTDHGFAPDLPGFWTLVPSEKPSSLLMVNATPETQPNAALRFTRGRLTDFCGNADFRQGSHSHKSTSRLTPFAPSFSKRPRSAIGAPTDDHGRHPGKAKPYLGS